MTVASLFLQVAINPADEYNKMIIRHSEHSDFAKALRLTLVLSCFLSSAMAQDNKISRNSFLSAGVIQLKESANFGLVFNGPEVIYGMKWVNSNDKRLIMYECELGLGVLFSRDIPAVGFYLKPIELAYALKLPISTGSIYVGPSLRADYHYNLYPDLQSGFDYWFTNFSVGVNVLYDFDFAKSSFRIMLSSSFMGFTSRQPEYRNPHFYDLGFDYAIKHLHQDLTFGSIEDYNISNLELWWRPTPDSRFTMGYVLNYSGYYQSPEITRVSHSIKLVFNKR